MRKLFLSLGLALALGGLAQAKTPPEVLKPYKAYRIAIKTGDAEEAMKQSYKAWQKAEELLGAHKTTGDLAANYADIKRQKPTPQEFRAWMKVYDRAIELSKFHESDAIEIELERHIKKLETGVSLVVRKRRRAVPMGEYGDFEKMDQTLESYNRKDSVFHGDMEVLRLKYFRLMGDWQNGIAAGKRASQIYKMTSENISSPYRDVLPLYFGDLYDDMGEPLEAALQYQKLIQGESGNRLAKTITDKAQSRWIKNWLKLEAVGLLENAKAKGLCDCAPNEKSDGKPIPITRIPPYFARKAERSGTVYLQFDLTDEGNPSNIKTIASTESLFEKSALQGAAKWRYSSITEHSNLEARQGILARIEYRLSNNEGKFIPAKPLKEITDFSESDPALLLENAIVVKGSRVNRR